MWRTCICDNINETRKAESDQSFRESAWRSLILQVTGMISTKAASTEEEEFMNSRNKKKKLFQMAVIIMDFFRTVLRRLVRHAVIAVLGRKFTYSILH